MPKTKLLVIGFIQKIIIKWLDIISTYIRFNGILKNETCLKKYSAKNLWNNIFLN